MKFRFFSLVLLFFVATGLWADYYVAGNGSAGNP